MRICLILSLCIVITVSQSIIDQLQTQIDSAESENVKYYAAIANNMMIINQNTQLLVAYQVVVANPENNTNYVNSLVQVLANASKTSLP